jgi:tetratricopeptide (TPR) repeat protein
MKLDPISAVVKSNVINMRILQDRLAEAAQEIEKLKSLNPEFHSGSAIMLDVAAGNLAEATLARLKDWSSRASENHNGIVPLQAQLAAMGFSEEDIPLAEADYLHAFAYQLLGRSSRIIEAFEADGGGGRKHHYALALAAVGDFERALPALEDVWQNLVGNLIVDPWFYGNHVVALREARIRAGDNEDSSDLIDAFENYVSKRAEAGIVGGNFGWDARFDAGILAWLKGRREEGIKLIRQAVERGYVIYPNEAYFQEIYDHPGFAEILEIQRQRQDSERTKLLSVICQDNPYVDLWSPPEESCVQLGSITIP